MKSRWNLFALLLLCQLARAADEIPPSAVRLDNGPERGQTLQVVNYSPAAGQVLDLTATPSRESYAVLNYVNPIQLAKSSADFRGYFSFRLFTPYPVALNCAALRMRDAAGEIFQYRIVLHRLRPGLWSDTGFLLCEATQTRDSWFSWGKNRNGKIDYPIELVGMTFDFDRSMRSKLQLFLADLKWVSDTNK